MLLTTTKVGPMGRVELVEQHSAEAAPEGTGVGQQSIGCAGLIDTGLWDFCIHKVHSIFLQIKTKSYKLISRSKEPVKLCFCC